MYTSVLVPSWFHPGSKGVQVVKNKIQTKVKM